MIGHVHCEQTQQKNILTNSALLHLEKHSVRFFPLSVDNSFSSKIRDTTCLFSIDLITVKKIKNISV